MNNHLQKNFTSFSLLLITLFLNITPTLSAQPKAPASPAAAPQMSPEDAKMLEEVEQQINSYVSSLPEDEQKKFWTDVEELTKVMSTMSEDELVKFMEDVFTEEAAAQKPAPAPEVTPSVKPEIKVEEKQPPLPADKQQAALKIIDGISTRINNFLRKAQTMVELPGKVISWQKESKLKNWPASLTWDVFKGHIEELNQKINKLKDRDPITNKYKYIDDFIKDEALYNNLAKLHDTLNKNEPAIELSSFGIERMTSSSREAIRKVLMGLQEAYTLMAIPQAIDKIFEKYDPTAKKLKEAEEAASKQALEASKKQRYAGPTSVGGIPAERRAADNRPFDYGDRGGRYTPTFDFPERKADRGEEKSEEGKKLGEGKGGGAPGKGGEGKGKEEKDKKEEQKKKEELKELKPAEEAVKGFEDALDTFEDALESNKNLGYIKDHMRPFSNTKEADPKLAASFRKANEAINKAKSMAHRMKRILSRPSVPVAQKKEFTNDMRKAYEIHKNLLIRVQNEIGEQVSQLSSASDNSTLNIKKYAYFEYGDKDTLIKQNPTKEEFIKKLEPINLSDLREGILELNKALAELQ